jgi:hypothetical protein
VVAGSGEAAAMIGIAIVIFAAWLSPTGRMVLLVIGALLALDLLAGLWRRRRVLPLQQRNRTRATAGAVVLVLCLFIAANGFPVIGWQGTAAIAALALLYLVVGVIGSQGSRVDAMSVFWWGVLALSCGAFLVFIEGFRL